MLFRYRLPPPNTDVLVACVVHGHPQHSTDHDAANRTPGFPSVIILLRPCARYSGQKVYPTSHMQKRNSGVPMQSPGKWSHIPGLFWARFLEAASQELSPELPSCNMSSVNTGADKRRCRILRHGCRRRILRRGRCRRILRHGSRSRILRRGRGGPCAVLCAVKSADIYWYECEK